ncbi:MAG: hypothetical protein ACLVJH_17760 [Faecalibacterium prausnitzii]
MELIVFAAASLTETLTAIGEIYSAENPGVTFTLQLRLLRHPQDPDPGRRGLRPVPSLPVRSR